MPYMALYRKWCPVSFEDVKGQGPIVQTLKNQITSERIDHAYLFCGVRGMGKTNIARIFARAVNCECPVDGNPRNECPAYKATQTDSSMNVVETDAVSNNGVENIRDIRDQVQYLPTEGWYKVYIIDEVHMLSVGALSALLKTLEEPPSYVIFILVTTGVHKTPITIPSRCQRYDFKRISLDTTAGRLRELIQAGQTEVEDKALMYIIKAVDGSLRDGLNLLDQCVAFHYGKVLIYDGALEVLGAMDTGAFSQMSGVVVDGRIKDRICVLKEIAIQGRELGQSITDLIWYMRNLLLIQSADDAEGLLDMSEENLKWLKADGEKVDGPTLMRYIRVFSELFNQLRYATQKRVLAEVALIKPIRPAMEPNLDSVLQCLGDLEMLMGDLEARRVTIQATAPAHAVVGTAGQAIRPVAASAEPEMSAERVSFPKAQPEDLKLARNEWVRIIRSMGRGAESYLRDTVVEPGSEGCLTIVLMDPMNHDMGKHPTIISELERYVETNYDKSIYFRTRLADRGERLNTIYVIEGELEDKIHMDITYED